MSDLDYNKVPNCPRCGTIGAIYLIKYAGTQIIVKQRCPTHGGKAYKIPKMQKDVFLPNLRSAIFRCYKCGQDATVDHTKVSGPWTLIKCNCLTHGNKLPYLKIWSDAYNEYFSGPEVVQQPIQQPVKQQVQLSEQQPAPAFSEEMKFCPNCGTPRNGIESFCSACGEELD